MRNVTKLAAFCIACIALAGCKKGYQCPEQKDTSQIAKWKGMGVPTDAKGITVCEASDQTFSARMVAPPTFSETATSLEKSFTAQGWQPTPSKSYTPRTDAHGVSRRLEKCGAPMNPLGTIFVDCEGEVNLAVDEIEANADSEVKAYLVTVDVRAGLKNHHILSPQ